MAYKLSIHSYSIAPGEVGQDYREHFSMELGTPLSAAIVTAVAIEHGEGIGAPGRSVTVLVDGVPLNVFARDHGIEAELADVERTIKRNHRRAFRSATN